MYEKLRRAELEITMLKERFQKNHRMLVKWQFDAGKAEWVDFPQSVSDKIEVCALAQSYTLVSCGS